MNKYSLNNMVKTCVENFEHKKEKYTKKVRDMEYNSPTGPALMSTICPNSDEDSDTCDYSQVSRAYLDENGDIFSFPKEDVSGTLIFVLLLSLIIWVYALYLLVKYWSELPPWAKVIGIIGLCNNGMVGGPFITLLAVYFGKMEGIEIEYL
jgi:hypothetical protein